MRADGLMAAWMLGSAGMLVWALAAAIPLVIHLWSRRRFQETSWAAMEFLLAALRKNARRLRLEQLLLLALRMAMLAVFALALAEPMRSRQGGSPLASPPRQTHHVLVVDTSYSMAFRGRDETRLESAQTALRGLLDANPGDGFTLLRMQDPPQVVIGELTFDQAEVRRAAERLNVSHGGADLSLTLSALERVVDGSRRRYPRIERIRVCWFTDLGSTTWDSATSPECRRVFDQLASQVEMSLVDVGGDSSLNFAVSGISRDRKLVTVGEDVRLEAQVRAFGARQPADARVEFLVDGRVIGGQDVRIPVEGSAVAAATHRFDTVDDAAVEARVTVDALPIDNQRWLVVPVRKSLEVLCIQGEPEAADYVALALNPSTAADAPIRAEVAPESSLLDRTLAQYDCVILNNVARISYDEARVLSRYVTQGGGLITVLGDLVQADNYNRELGEAAGEHRVLPARLEQIVRDGPQLFDPLDYQHPLVAPFRGFERAGLLTVPSWRYFRLRIASPQVEVAVAFDRGDPAIVGEGVGLGHSLLVATSLSPSSRDEAADGVVPWSALPAWPSFPPLVHGLVRWAASGRESQREILVQSPLEFVARESLTVAAEVTLPDGSSQRIACSPSEGISRCSFAGTAQRGIYSVRMPDGAKPGRKLFAVNVDPREGNLARTSADSLPAVFSSPEVPSTESTALDDRNTVPFFRGLLVAVAALLLAESALACWFARRSA